MFLLCLPLSPSAGGILTFCVFQTTMKSPMLPSAEVLRAEYLNCSFFFLLTLSSFVFPRPTGLPFLLAFSNVSFFFCTSKVFFPLLFVHFQSFSFQHFTQKTPHSDFFLALVVSFFLFACASVPVRDRRTRSSGAPCFSIFFFLQVLCKFRGGKDLASSSTPNATFFLRWR